MVIIRDKLDSAYGEIEVLKQQIQREKLQFEKTYVFCCFILLFVLQYSRSVQNYHGNTFSFFEINNQ